MMRRLVVSASPGAFADARRLWLLLVVAACHHDKPIGTNPVSRIVVSLSAPDVIVGNTLQASARLLDASGSEVMDRSATWTSLTPTVLSVTASGVATGLQPGNGLLRASSGNVSADAVIAVRNPFAVSVTLNRDTATLLLPNASLQLFPTVRDDQGRVIQNPAIVFSSDKPAIAAVNTAGLVTSVASGTATVTGTIENLTSTIQVTVRPTPNAAAPQITSIVPAVLRPGGSITVSGVNFATTAAGNGVLIDGIPATVQSASSSQLGIVLAASGYPCDASHVAYIQITANGTIGGGAAILSAPVQRLLNVGQTVVITNTAEVRCNELSQAGGRYAASIYAAARNAVTPTSPASVQFQIKGTLAPDATTQPRASVAPAPASISLPRIGSRAFDLADDRRRMHEREAAHASVLERNIAAARGANLAALRAQSPPTRDPRAALQLATVGSITQLKVPNVDAPDFCTTSIPVGVRSVFVGAHMIIVEDTATQASGHATLAGQMDDYITRLGQEFESVMYPIITANFGNPLAMDAQLSGTGKVVMLLSPRVNVMVGGSLLGFVASCDFFPASARPSSNLGEFLYAYVPTSAQAGYVSGAETKDQWMRQMRSTTIHEVKHITAFGERLSRKLDLEDLSWEEGMARVAEELYARTFYGTQFRQNAGYAQTIACDIQYVQRTPPCADRPILMLRHFDAMYTFLGTPEVYSPLGRTFAGDGTFYAVAWSMLRWGADHFASTESQFLKDFTTSAVTGAANFEARTGRPWEESLGEWSLALFLDDLAGYTPENPRIKIPSWNFVDIFNGLCSDLGPCSNPNNPVLTYIRNPPYSPRARPFGSFLLGVGALAGGGFTLLDLSGSATGVQVVELRAFVGGGDPPSSLRLAITRIR